MYSDVKIIKKAAGICLLKNANTKSIIDKQISKYELFLLALIIAKIDSKEKIIEWWSENGTPTGGYNNNDTDKL